MNIYPAIDLKSGACVRLIQGCYDRVTNYSTDPLMLADNFSKQGAEFLHVVDLDAARDSNSLNWELIKTMAKSTELKIQTGGGIRTKVQIVERLEQGIFRVILGSIAISEPELVKEYLIEFGSEKIVLAFDVRMDAENIPKVAINAWQTQTENTLWDYLDDYQQAGLNHVLCTDIQRDGMLKGPNIDLYQACVQRYPNLDFQASGGVAGLDDLQSLAALNVAGVIIGKALYENKFTLTQAIEKVNKC